MQTITTQKYPFFRNPPHKRRTKTIQSSNGQYQQTSNNKQTAPVLVRRRNYLKQAPYDKSIQKLNFRPKKIVITNNNVQIQNNTYRKYTQQFSIPKIENRHLVLATQTNAESSQQLVSSVKDDHIKYQQVDTRISQSNNMCLNKKGSLSNNKSYDHNKRTAVFTRKGLYSINSLQKEKKSSIQYYPSERYKILNSKQVLIGASKDNLADVSHRKQRQTFQKQKQRQMVQSKKNSFSISRNRYLQAKDQKKSVRKQIRITNRRPQHHSNSHTHIVDNNFQKLIKNQFSSLSVKQLNHQPEIRNRLDQMYLTQYQKEQIKNYKDVYYIGHKAYLRKHKEQANFRDQKCNYKPIMGDHIAYRFEILRVLGSGAFGKVLEVIDHKQPAGSKKKTYALKILKKSQDLYEQFKLEIAILKIIKQNPEATKNIVQIKGDFQFRNHICIITQLLDLNVYAFIKNQEFEGLSLQITRKIMIQVLQALLFLHNKQIVHCDIKPQNIVFKQQGKSGVKLIDFGSACFIDKKQFTYIQSRYYRSPQIVLVKPYDQKIDVWSTGCLAYQIFTGSPLFPARCEQQQLQMLKQTLGKPPKDFLDKCQRAQQFPFEDVTPILPLSKRIDAQKTSYAFLDFLQKMIRWSPEQRMTTKQALMHQFILEGLPQKVRREHVSQMKSSNPYRLYQEG